MPDVTKPGSKSRMWLVTGTLVDAIWRPDWVLLHVEIDDAEACAIMAAAREMVDKLNPGAVTDVEMPVIRIDKKLCLKAWGRSVSTIRNKDGEDLVSVKAGARITLKVALSPYRDPARGWRVTAFPGRIDVLKPAKGKKALAEERARNVAERAAAKAAAPKPVQAPKPVKPPRAPRTMPTAANIIPFPITETKH